MATGADEKFWQNARLRGVLKHGIIKRYLPVFLSRTSARYSKSAVYFDGYAGRGRYEDGRPSSAGLMMDFATNQKFSQGRDYTLLLYERDKESFESLAQLAEQYRQRGLDVRAERKDVAAVLDEVMTVAANKPMFVFLDPCGVGIPFDAMTRLLNRNAPSHQPPTEVLLNFNHAAVTRIGGHLRSPSGNEATIRRMDDAVGGTWWHEAFEQSEKDVVRYVIDGFKRRLAEATGMLVQSVQVSDGPEKPPIYDLVFGHDIRVACGTSLTAPRSASKTGGRRPRLPRPKGRSSRSSRVSKMLRQRLFPSLNGTSSSYFTKAESTFSATTQKRSSANTSVAYEQRSRELR